MPKQGKNRGGRALYFDALSFQDFDTIPSIGAGVANSVIQARLPFPLRLKLFKVGVTYSAIGTGTHAINICLGPGPEIAPVGIGVVNGLATSGQNANTMNDVIVSASGSTVFAADQVLTQAADTPNIFIPTNENTIYDQGVVSGFGYAELTLRVVTPPTTGSLTNLKVVLLVCPEDPLPNHQGATAGVDF